MGITKNEDKRSSLKRENQRSFDNRNEGGGFYTFNLPSGTNWIKWEKDVKYRHLILAFQAGKNHPLVKSGDFKEGELVRSVEYWVHKGLGVDGKKSTLCLKSTFGKPCPVCEYISELKERGKSQEADNIKPKIQTAYLMYDVKAGKKEFSVLACANILFELPLVELARAKAKGENDFVDYPYVDGEGKIIDYMAKEERKKGYTFLKASGLSFENIEEDDNIPHKFLSNPFCLDDCLRIPTYEDVQKILFAADEDEEETVSRDEDDKTEPDEEPEEKVTRPEKQECPHGHKFGKDNDKFEDDCDDCKVWNACKKAKKEKEKE